VQIWTAIEDPLPFGNAMSGLDHRVRAAFAAQSADDWRQIESKVQRRELHRSGPDRKHDFEQALRQTWTDVQSARRDRLLSQLWPPAQAADAEAIACTRWRRAALAAAEA